MGITKAERERKERERRDAEWKAEEDRVRAVGNLFSALPSSPEKDALHEAMSGRVVEFYNNCKWHEGDAVLEFLPNDYARALLDWYFDEDSPPTFELRRSGAHTDISSLSPATLPDQRDGLACGEAVPTSAQQDNSTLSDEPKTLTVADPHNAPIR